MGYCDIYLDSTESTNLVAKKMAAEGAAHGTGVLAEAQSRGRGRLGRTWHSPKSGNLYCSYVLRPALEPADVPKLTLVAGVAVAEWFNDYLDSVTISLKWPNDLLIGGRKCGGILCESWAAGGLQPRPAVVVGIGVNCNSRTADLPPELRGIATSIRIAGGVAPEPEIAFLGIRERLLHCLDDFSRYGFSPLLRRWKRLDGWRGTWMVWETPDGQRIRGKSLGPDHDGMLRVESADGTIHTVMTGDVRLADEKNPSDAR